MADLIDRQAAIDAINHELRCGAVADQCGLETAYELIKDLPSAQTKTDSDCISRESTLNVIAEYLEEYSETDQDGNHDPKWCAMKEAELLVKDMPSAQSDKGDCISKAETLEALNTWDKFACMPNEQLVPMRELDNPEQYVPYIKYGDAYNCVMNMPSSHQTLYGYTIEQYGYTIEHLALIAKVMEIEGISPEKAIRKFENIQYVYELLIDEIQNNIEKLLKDGLCGTNDE